MVHGNVIVRIMAMQTGSHSHQNGKVESLAEIVATMIMLIGSDVP
jgi:hypothetical protein